MSLFRSIQRILSLTWTESVLLCGNLKAAEFRVGAGGISGGCTHSTIPGAILEASITPGPDTIYIANDQCYIDQEIVIETTCTTHPCVEIVGNQLAREVLGSAVYATGSSEIYFFGGAFNDNTNDANAASSDGASGPTSAEIEGPDSPLLELGPVDHGDHTLSGVLAWSQRHGEYAEKVLDHVDSSRSCR